MVEIKRKVSLKKKTEKPEPSASATRTDVNIRRKVTLKEKSGGVVEEKGVDTTPVGSGNSGPSGNGNPLVLSKSKKFILGTIVLLLLAGGIYALINKSKVGQTEQEPLAVSTIPVNNDTQQSAQNDYSQPGSHEQSEAADQLGEFGDSDSPTDNIEVPPVSSEEGQKGSVSTEKPEVSQPSVPTSETPVSSVTNGSVSNNQNSNVNGAVANKSVGSSQTQIKQAVANTDAATLWENLDKQAKEVILGEYGNGIARMEALGDMYDEIQAKVNEYYRLKYGN
jgi:hypothetical protein